MSKAEADEAANAAHDARSSQAHGLDELRRIAYELRKLEDELNRGLQPRRDLEDFIRSAGAALSLAHPPKEQS
jgi:hypothetical protein